MYLVLFLVACIERSILHVADMFTYGLSEKTHLSYGFVGTCGITLNIGYSQANNTAVPSDVEAADRAMQFDVGWFAHPIFSKDGDFPAVMKDRVRFRSQQQKVPNRLPTFSAQEIQDLKGNCVIDSIKFEFKFIMYIGVWFCINNLCTRRIVVDSFMTLGQYICYLITPIQYSRLWYKSFESILTVVSRDLFVTRFGTCDY